MPKPIIPLVSVVIPTFNRAAILRNTLNSLLQQTFNNFEVIIADDGSSDDTGSLVNEYVQQLNITYLYLPHSGLPSVARNEAIRVANAPYIAFLDSDDSWLPQKLSESIKYLNRGYEFIHHDASIIYDSMKSKNSKILPSRQLRSPIHQSLITSGNPIITSTVVVEKKLLLEAGFFNEDPKLRCGEDYDLWLRIAFLTNRFKHISQAYTNYMVSRGSLFH